MNRKEFLKLSALGVAGTAISFPLLGHAFSMQELTSGSHFDVLIIGTGYGASVSALRLAEAGKKCLMLEMGLDWDKSGIPFSNMVTPTKESTWLANTSNLPFLNYALFPKFTGALDLLEYENIKVYQGRGVGGGSLVNGGIAVTPRRDVFEQVFPELDADLFFNTYFPLANTELGVSSVPEDFYENANCYRYARVGKQEAENAGYETGIVPNVYDFDYMRKEENWEVPRSALASEGLCGNNHGKKDLRKTYIQKALDTGNVTIMGLHRADQIIEKENGFEVSVSQINTKGEVVETKTYSTVKLFLCAGSIGTNELLLKSKAKGTLPNVDQTIGKKWGNNGNATAFRTAVPPYLGFVQSTMVATSVENWTGNDDSFVAEVTPVPLGIDSKSALYLMINKVKQLGEITYDENEEKAKVQWSRVENANIRENGVQFLNNLNQANGGLPFVIPDFPEGVNDTLCYHSLGGVVLHDSTDGKGRLNHHDGLYVIDSSLIPGTIGVNPFVTITAIAEYCIEDIIANDFNDDDDPVDVQEINLAATPNPFSSHLNITFHSPEETMVQFVIINWAGRVVGSTDFYAQAGDNQFTWTGLSYLWNESYWLRIQINNQVDSIQVVKRWSFW